MTVKDFRMWIARIIAQYSFPVKAKVSKVYAESGKYYLDCKELDLTDAETDVIIPKVPIAKVWGGAKCGVFAMPEVDSIVIVGFLRGNKHFPYIDRIMGTDHDIEHPEKEIIVVYDTTELRLKDKKIVARIDDDTELLIEDKKITAKTGNNSTVLQTENNFKIGGDNATESLVLGDTLKTAFETLMTALKTHTHTVSTSGSATAQSGTAAPSAGLASQTNPLTNALSTYGKVK